jgi:hypothetical protein
MVTLSCYKTNLNEVCLVSSVGDPTVAGSVPMSDDGKVHSAESRVINFKTVSCVMK